MRNPYLVAKCIVFYNCNLVFGAAFLLSACRVDVAERICYYRCGDIVTGI
jgi:hypothetical protein